MLQNFWASNAAFFVDVPNNQNGNSCFFRKFYQFRGALFYLRHAPRRCIKMFCVQGLNRVNHQDFRSNCFDVFKDVLSTGFCENQAV